MDLLEQIPATLDPAKLDTVTDAVVGRSRVWHILRRNPMFWVGATIVVVVFAGALLAPVIAPHDPLEQFRDAINAKGDPTGPSAKFPLGVDIVGRDYLSRLLYGARTSLLIGIGANLIATFLGLLVGSVAALVRSPRVPFPGGRLDGHPAREPAHASDRSVARLSGAAPDDRHRRCRRTERRTRHLHHRDDACGRRRPGSSTRGWSSCGRPVSSRPRPRSAAPVCTCSSGTTCRT